jgi:hypothetical protein
LDGSRPPQSKGFAARSLGRHRLCAVASGLGLSFAIRRIAHTFTDLFFMKHTIALIPFCVITSWLNAGDVPHDVVVYGDSSGAVVAAISAKREGRSVIWVNPTSFPGGMSSSGQTGHLRRHRR